MRFPENTKWEDIAFTRPLLASSKKIIHFNEPKYIYRQNLFNTTLSDFLNPTPKILDIFKTCDEMQANFIKLGVYDEYSDIIKLRQVFSCMLRVQNSGLWFKLPKKDRIELTNSLVNLIEIKYGEWKNNCIYLDYKKENSFFRESMNYIENKILDDRMRKETDEYKVKKYIQEKFDRGIL